MLRTDARRLLRPFVLAALASTTTCTPPLQNGDIVVFAGAAERLGMLCRWRHDGSEQSGLCPPTETDTSPAVAETSRLSLSVREVGPTPSVDVDPTRSERPTPAKVSLLDPATGNVVAPPLFTISGDLEIQLPPGHIRVVASHGPEFSLAEATVDLTEGAPTRLELRVARVVDTSGYIACDFPQNAAVDAPDASTALERQLVVEGVECAVERQQEASSARSPSGRERALEEYLRIVEIGELAADAGRAPVQHESVDLVEVWRGSQEVAERGRALEELWARLRASRPGTPIASSDRHDIENARLGSPRTYVGVTEDDPTHLEATELGTALRKRRDVVITNGPFVTVRLGDARQGGLVSIQRPGRSTQLALSIRVERAPWVDAREVVVLVGGVAGPVLPLVGEHATAAGALADELNVPVQIGKSARRDATGADSADSKPGSPSPIHIAEDTFLVVVVRGRHPLDPALAVTETGELPFAMTSPIWIDADGDGRALGR